MKYVGIIVLLALFTLLEAFMFMVLLGVIAGTFGVPVAIGYGTSLTIWLVYAVLRTISSVGGQFIKEIGDL